MRSRLDSSLAPVAPATPPHVHVQMCRDRRLARLSQPRMRMRSHDLHRSRSDPFPACRTNAIRSTSRCSRETDPKAAQQRGAPSKYRTHQLQRSQHAHLRRKTTHRKQHGRDTTVSCGAAGRPVTGAAARAPPAASGGAAVAGAARRAVRAGRAGRAGSAARGCGGRARAAPNGAGGRRAAAAAVRLSAAVDGSTVWASTASAERARPGREVRSQAHLCALPHSCFLFSPGRFAMTLSVCGCFPAVCLSSFCLYLSSLSRGWNIWCK